CGTDAATLMCGPHICMANQGSIEHLLQSHHAAERTRILPPPEAHPAGDFSQQFVSWHVRLMPAIRRNNTLVCPCSLVHDGFYDGIVGSGAWAHHQGPSWW